MSRFGSVLKTECVSCGKLSPHNVTFAKDAICHLRCMVCGAMNAFFLKQKARTKDSNQMGGVEHLDHAALTKPQAVVSSPVTDSPSPRSAGALEANGKHVNHDFARQQSRRQDARRL